MIDIEFNLKSGYSFLLAKCYHIPIAIRIFLIWVWCFRTVIHFIQNSIIVHIGIAIVSHTISVSVFLIQIWQQWAIITCVSSFVVTINFSI